MGETPEGSIPLWLMGALIGMEGLVLFTLEYLRPLRAPQESKLRRDTRNAAIAGLALTATAMFEVPIAARLSRLVEARRLGIVPRLPLPRWARTVVAVTALDYTMYLWHALAHQSPLLWRFHAVHHVDRGLDASTALRFHVGEQLLSIPWRVGQILIVGATPRQLAIWQTAFLASILFHHSDVRLGARIERAVGRFVMTPFLHGIHHANRREFQSANFSSALTLWDRLHRTYRDDADQATLTMGLPAYHRDGDVTFAAMLALPLLQPRDAFEDSAAL